jgi:hypothetical protein
MRRVVDWKNNRRQLLDSTFEVFGSKATWYGGPVVLGIVYGIHWLQTATWPTWRLHDWITIQPEHHWLGTVRIIEWFLDLELFLSFSILYFLTLICLLVSWMYLVLIFNLYGDPPASKTG